MPYIIALNLFLCALAAGSLIYTAQRARRAALGDKLLDACGGSYEVALQACQSVKDEHELLVDAVVEAYKQDTH